MSEPTSKPGPMNATVTTVAGVKKADTTSLVTNASDDPDDTFTGMYTADGKGGIVILEPPFKPGVLRRLTTQNNILAQCISAMEVSIDGTGHTIEAVESELDKAVKAKERERTKAKEKAKKLAIMQAQFSGTPPHPAAEPDLSILDQELEAKEKAKANGEEDEEDIEAEVELDPEKQALIDFFDEPYPGKSMVTIRRALRNDMESTGNGYLEVIRNAKDEIVMLNHLPACDMRLVRYDEPTLVDRVLTRRGRELKVKIRARQRRFVQIINGVRTFFKEFNASRDIDRTTGKWSEGGTRLGVQLRGSEVIHFKVLEDPKSPYGLPRWINQLPSVLGSRKAEEFNLEFFDSGGLPPVLVVVQGGYLADGVKDSLTAHLSGSATSKHRAAIVEAISSSGSLDSSGTVKVTVERFGAERQQDSMFQNYDKNAEDHVRTSFRLPPLFTGRAQDYNFATAMTGYMVAEAQIFGTERLLFDEVMWWLVQAMGIKKYTFKSKALSLIDAANQLKAMEIVINKDFAEKESVLHALNSLTGMSLEYKEPDQALAQPFQTPPNPNLPPQPQNGSTAPQNAPKEPSKTDPVMKSDRAQELVTLATQWCHVLGLTGDHPVPPAQADQITAKVQALKEDDLKLFTTAMASMSLTNSQHDLAGLAELCGYQTPEVTLRSL